jgi:DNA-binding NarL/FixJ family response regulator
MDKLQSDGAEHNEVSVSIRAMHTKPPLSNSDARYVPTRRNHHQLSEREIQILKDLVKGHANKVIARTYDITEATVKVHVRTILRKIRVGNRTQAAIWARENGYTASDFKGPLEAVDMGS